jgi:hypothetical protein
MPSDVYCFICGHYLTDAHILTSKNKKVDIGGQTPEKGGTFVKVTPAEEEPIIYVYEKDTTDILYHTECYDVLSKKCKYKMNYKDMIENLEYPNSHGLVPYENIERPPNVDSIKKEHTWSEEQIVEEWGPVIDEVRTKNKSDKDEKRKQLQERREAKREQLKKQRDKRKERIDGMKTKLTKMMSSREKDLQIIQEKTTILSAIQSDKRKDRIIRQIQRLEDKAAKKEEDMEKHSVKIEEAESELDLFIRAWF